MFTLEQGDPGIPRKHETPEIIRTQETPGIPRSQQTLRIFRKQETPGILAPQLRSPRDPQDPRNPRDTQGMKTPRPRNLSNQEIAVILRSQDTLSIL